jgi:hypothetical protein
MSLSPGMWKMFGGIMGTDLQGIERVVLVYLVTIIEVGTGRTA